MGVLYAHWASGEAHPEGPQPYATTLAAPAAAGSDTITVAAATSAGCTSAPATSSAFCGAGYDWYTSETISFGTPGTAGFGTATIAAISGDTVTLTAPLTAAQAQGTAVASQNGPSGLLVKIVVDYAGGASSVFVSDGSWLVTKDTAELNTTAQVRSGQGAGDYVEYDSAPGAQALAGWDRAGYAPGPAWQPATVMGTAPLPNPPDCGNYYSGASPCGFTHLVPLQAPVTYKVVHPVSVTTLPDGTTEADFGDAFIATPVVRFPGAGAAQAGNQVTLTTSYRLAGTTLAAPAAAGATSISVTDSSAVPGLPRLRRGDRLRRGRPDHDRRSRRRLRGRGSPDRHGHRVRQCIGRAGHGRAGDPAAGGARVGGVGAGFPGRHQQAGHPGHEPELLLHAARRGGRDDRVLRADGLALPAGATRAPRPTAGGR